MIVAVGRRGLRFAPPWLVLLTVALSARSALAAPEIPLAPGLVITAVSHYDGGDHDVLRIVESADAEAVTYIVRWSDRAAAEGGGEESFAVKRVLRRQDLESANRVIGNAHTQDPEMFPGSTAMQASRALLEKLKTGAETPFIFGTAAGPMGNFGARKYYRGNLKLAEAEPVPFPVLLNGVRTTLPAIHAKGTLKVGDDVGEGEFWWLDQPDNAVSLRWTFKDVAVLVIRIDTPASAQQSAAVATSLASGECRADLYGVYFNSGSAALLEQSAAAITQVAALLQQEPAWRITIEGHTDSIGTDADNELLSRERAEAVRAALVEQGIAAERLSAAGFGESRPMESNDTMEGRARNRRVELARECQ
jgi:outer membrane protein OmpA-like peptidoglycan-associated protein